MYKNHKLSIQKEQHDLKLILLNLLTAKNEERAKKFKNSLELDQLQEKAQPIMKITNNNNYNNRKSPKLFNNGTPLITPKHVPHTRTKTTIFSSPRVKKTFIESPKGHIEIQNLFVKRNSHQQTDQQQIVQIQNSQNNKNNKMHPEIEYGVAYQMHQQYQQQQNQQKIMNRKQSEPLKIIPFINENNVTGNSQQQNINNVRSISSKKQRNTSKVTSPKNGEDNFKKFFFDKKLQINTDNSIKKDSNFDKSHQQMSSFHNYDLQELLNIILMSTANILQKYRQSQEKWKKEKQAMREEINFFKSLLASTEQINQIISNQ